MRNYSYPRTELSSLLVVLVSFVAILALSYLSLEDPAAAGAPPKPQRACPSPLPGTQQCYAEIVPPSTGGSLRGPSLGAEPSYSGSGQLGGYSPKDLYSAYAFTPGESANQTIAVIDAYDDPKAEEDLNVYRSEYGLGACTEANGCFRKVNQTGGTTYPAPDYGWSVEISLDLDMASAACPTCRLLLVEATNNSVANLAIATNQAALMGATVITNSYGSPEVAGSSAYRPYYNHPGIPTFASSGDNGYRNYLSGGNAPSYPASSPDTIAAGGTTLVPAENARKWNEIVWNRSGGGCGLQVKPAWQTDAGCSTRMDNDVAAVASTETPVSVYDTYLEGGWTLLGGTSVSSPLLAGIMAHSTPYTKSLGPSALYSAGLSRFDITTGSNYKSACSPAYLCAAVAGYDGPTGVGTPNGIPKVSPGSEGAWGIVGSQRPADSGSEVPLLGVSCTSVSACTAVGTYSNTSGVWGAMGNSWNGASWPSEPVIANPGPKNGALASVSCTSASSCVAVGHYENSSKEVLSLAEGKSGSSWTVQPTVDPAGGKPTELYGVSCATASSCTAVGHSFATGAGIWGAMGEEWNGSTWSLLPVVVNPGKKNGFLKAVSCVTATWCMAVGSYGTSSGIGVTLAEERNGGTWTVKTTPNPSSSNSVLNGISCTSTTFCIAVGSSAVSVWIEGPEGGHSALLYLPIAERWNGSTWTLESFPLPKKDGENEALNSVSCVSSSLCFAVGLKFGPGYRKKVIKSRNASTWTTTTTPEPVLGPESTLSGISCTAATSCMTIGDYVDGLGKHATFAMGLFGP